MRTILPQGRRPLSVVKTDVMFAPCRAQRASLSRTTRIFVAHSAHFCRAQRAFLSRTARTSATEARLLSHFFVAHSAHFCHRSTSSVATMLHHYWYKRYALTQDAAYEIHLHHCETITIAILVRIVACGLRSMIRPMCTQVAHTWAMSSWLIGPTRP